MAPHIVHLQGRRSAAGRLHTRRDLAAAGATIGSANVAADAAGRFRDASMARTLAEPR